MTVVNSQENLSLKIFTPFEDDCFIIDEFEVFEGLSTPYECRILVHSLQCGLEIKKLLGKEITLLADFEDKKRIFRGMVGKIIQKDTFYEIQEEHDYENEYLAYYEIFLYPQFWFLKNTMDCRIFQNKSVIQIIKTIFKEFGFSNFQNRVLHAGKKKRDYCVQFNESYFDFISRLLEEEGIFYFFIHKDDHHIMVLADSTKTSEASYHSLPMAMTQSPLLPLDRVTKLLLQQQITPQTYLSNDYNYLKPQTKMRPSLKGKDGFGKVYEFPGFFSNIQEGEHIASIRHQELEWSKETIEGKSSAFRLKPGYRFHLTDHPREHVNREYLAYQVKHFFKQNTQNQDDFFSDNQPQWLYYNEFIAFPSSAHFRPLRVTPKKRIHNHQTAIVVGPLGEEVFCDALGRIKIQFHWDIRGEFNDKSSCWVRVAQNWAGAGWGGLVIPRINMEVVVSFIDGDPDRPLVTGCVYNASNLPPEYAQSSPTCSTFRTHSSKEGQGFNELSFEDKKDSELIYLQAEKDLKAVIKDNRDELIVKGNDRLVMLKGHKQEYMLGDNSLHLVYTKNGIREKRIDIGNDSTQVFQGNIIQNVNNGKISQSVIQGNHEIYVGENITADATGQQKLNDIKSDLINKGSHALKTVYTGIIQESVCYGNIIHSINEGSYIAQINKGNYAAFLVDGHYHVQISSSNKVQSPANEPLLLIETIGEFPELVPDSSESNEGEENAQSSAAQHINKKGNRYQADDDDEDDDEDDDDEDDDDEDDDDDDDDEDDDDDDDDDDDEDDDDEDDDDEDDDDEDDDDEDDDDEDDDDEDDDDEDDDDEDDDDEDDDDEDDDDEDDNDEDDDDEDDEDIDSQDIPPGYKIKNVTQPSTQISADNFGNLNLYAKKNINITAAEGTIVLSAKNIIVQAQEGIVTQANTFTSNIELMSNYQTGLISFHNTKLLHMQNTGLLNMTNTGLANVMAAGLVNAQVAGIVHFSRGEVLGMYSGGLLGVHNSGLICLVQGVLTFLN